VNFSSSKKLFRLDLQDLEGRSSFFPQILLILRLLQNSFIVIPVKAGIQVLQAFLDPGFRRGDGLIEFCKRLSCQSFLFCF